MKRVPVYQDSDTPKQYARVLDAVVEAGCRTSREVADETELPINVCSAWLSQLEADGAIIMIDDNWQYSHKRGPGRLYNVYRPATAADVVRDLREAFDDNEEAE